MSDKKADFIREMLLKTVEKKPDLFCYYSAIQEARELLGQSDLEEVKEVPEDKPLRVLADI